MLRLLLLLVGAALVGASCFVTVTPVADGGVTLEGFWVAMLGVAVLALGVAWRPGWRRAGLLTAALVLALAGQLAATSPLWLQRFEIRLWKLEESPLLVASWSVVALQWLSVARWALARQRELRSGLAPLLTRGRLIALGVLFAACGAHVTLAFDPGRGTLELGQMLRVLVQYPLVLLAFLANLGHLCALGAALPAGELVRAREALRRSVALIGSDLPPTGLDRALPWLLAAFATVTAAALSWSVLERVPHVPDGFAYVFQARCLAMGAFAAKAPAAVEAFGLYLIDFQDGRMFSVCNPGWPAVLAVGAFVGAEWLVNPLLGGAAVLLAHALVRRIADRGTAHVLALLVATSPWFLWVNASFMTHSLTLVLCLAGWLGVARARFGPAFGGGLCMGLICTVRPLDGLAVGTLTGLWTLGLGRRRLPLFAILTYAVGCVAGAAVLLGYNAAFTGDPLFFPINDYLDRLWYAGANSIGFGADKGNPGGWNLDPLPGHGPWDVLYNTNQNLYYLNFELLGWGTGSLFPIAVHLLRGRLTRLDRALFVYLAALVVAYSAYWYSGGSDYGARYWYPMFLPAIWLVWRGVQTTGELLATKFEAAELRVTAVAGISVALSLAVFLPWRALAKYVDYRGFHADFARLVRDGAIGNELVLVEVADESEYGAAFVLNDPAWSPDRPVFAWDRDPEVAEAAKTAFPDRDVIRIRGRSVNGLTEIVDREPARER